MKKVGIALDNWKLPIFKRHLDTAGYEYQESPGPTKDTVILTVETAFVSDLQFVVMAAQKECSTQ